MFGFLKSFMRSVRRGVRGGKKSPQRERPRVEALEDRLVPSYMVMDVPGRGIYLLDTNPYGKDSGWLASNHADRLAVDTSGDVLADLPGQGLWAYSNAPGRNHGWHQLSKWQACAMAIAGSGGSYDVAASFLGHGTYENTGYASMKSLTTVVAGGLGIDTGGNILGEFKGLGVWYHSEYGNWQRVTSLDANALSYSGGWAVLSFAGRGVYRGEVAQGSWQQISSAAPNGLYVNANGDVLMGVAGRGLQLCYGGSSSWQQLSAATNEMGISGGEVGGYFNGQGVWTYNTATGRWSQKLSFTTDCFAFEQ
jgi:hypothetical protein